MRAPERPSSKTTMLAGWIGRIVLLLGGTTLAVRAGLPAGTSQPAAAAINPDEQPQKGDLDNGDTGRGRHETPPTSSAVKSGHETEDLSGGTLSKLFLGLAVGVTIIIGGIIGFRTIASASDSASAKRLTVEQKTAIVPPAPTLQANPVQELAAMHAREEKLLANYAWVDADHTAARIPLERAMTLIVGHPLDTAP